jgi:hypothetical protein
MFGRKVESSLLPWEWARTRLETAGNYWICTTRPDGRPHARPVWGIWDGGRFAFSTGSLATRNLPANPEITVHLESGNQVVIVEGRAAVLEDRARLVHVARLYSAKYNWPIDPDNPPGPFYDVSPHRVFGWNYDPTGADASAEFPGNATRWSFPGASSSE